MSEYVFIQLVHAKGGTCTFIGAGDELKARVERHCEKFKNAYVVCLLPQPCPRQADGLWLCHWQPGIREFLGDALTTLALSAE